LFANVDPEDLTNARYWCQQWHVTYIQLRIAVTRVGNAPSAVRTEILGLRAATRSDLLCHQTVAVRQHGAGARESPQKFQMAKNPDRPRKNKRLAI
jgi:hypothetical protein